MKRVAIEVNTSELCSYGCGDVAQFKNGSGNLMCLDSSNKCPAVRERNRIGTTKSHVNRDSKLQYAEFSQETKYAMNWNKDNYSNVEFVYNGKGSHRKALIFERGNVCERCKLSHWMDGPISLELDHIDGDNKNHVKENLRLLCPNCHAQTDTWRGRNINSGKIKVTDDVLLVALHEEDTIRQALLKVGLSAKGGNYARCYKLLDETVILH